MAELSQQLCEVYIVLVYCGVGIIKTIKCSTGTCRYRATDSKSKHKQIFVFASQIQFVKETSSQEYENSLEETLIIRDCSLSTDDI